jgi:hypothetical protein
MPPELPSSVRHEIITLRSQGLAEIASQLHLPYGSIRRIWRHSRTNPSRPLNPDYSRCGRTPSPVARALIQAACRMKRVHATWGAGLFRV